jgi:hypothetical protein
LAKKDEKEYENMQEIEQDIELVKDHQILPIFDNL